MEPPRPLPGPFGPPLSPDRPLVVGLLVADLHGAVGGAFDERLTVGGDHAVVPIAHRGGRLVTRGKLHEPAPGGEGEHQQADTEAQHEREGRSAAVQPVRRPTELGQLQQSRQPEPRSRNQHDHPFSRERADGCAYPQGRKQKDTDTLNQNKVVVRAGAEREQRAHDAGATEDKGRAIQRVRNHDSLNRSLGSRPSDRCQPGRSTPSNPKLRPAAVANNAT